MGEPARYKRSFARQTSRFDQGDKANIEAAREEILASGSRILDELQRSNCDRRLIDQLSYLQSQISTDENIVKVGICNIGCEFMRDAFAHELPEAVCALLRAHTRSVELFAGQFPEWNRFVENAATVNITSDDVRDVRDATERLVKVLRDRPEIVDAEVPKTLSRLNAMLQNPSVASKKAAFAMLRSVENLVSSIFDYGVKFLEKTADKTLDGLSSVASKAVIVGLLSLALGGATGISGVASKIGEMAWLGNAAKLVQNQISQMSQK